MQIKDSKALKRALNRAAKHYEKAAFLQHEIVKRMLQKLEFIRIEPEVVLDFGSRTGFSSEQLKKIFPHARIISFDIAEQLLQKKGRRLFKKKYENVCGDFNALPFRDRSIDMIFSTLNLHFSNDLKSIFAEFRRVLNPNGMILFSLFGPDTLKELRQSFGENVHLHMQKFIDMHDIGDLLLQASFENPVMDMEYLTIYYSNLDKLFYDIKVSGMQNVLDDRPRALMGKKNWHNMLKYYENFRDDKSRLPATIEIIYGHAWQGNIQQGFSANQHNEVVIPINSILKTRGLSDGESE